MSRPCLFYKSSPEHNRWIPGDRFFRPLARRVVRGAPTPGGVDKVFTNLCLGLEKLGVKYEVNLPFDQLRPDDQIGVLGRGRYCLNGYDRPNPIVAGIGLMTHPSEWPNLCKEYPVATYLQHSRWSNDLYRPFFGERCQIWPVGIDTDSWLPAHKSEKSVDFLIYNKIRWDVSTYAESLLEPIRRLLKRKNLTVEELRYGTYQPEQFQAALRRCRAMVFLCEHESQGLAYQECLSGGVPILAWDQGRCLDPNRFSWGAPDIPATSVPYWDERCGLKFKDMNEFTERLNEFLDLQARGEFSPRDYILENLTLEKCARNYLAIMDEANSRS
jgi:glycosyltransferase involved in cell wall biosynthesis